MKKQILFLLTYLTLCVVCFSQNDAWKHIYRATETKFNDLVHTKLDLRFDYTKSWAYGKAWITLHPHFYATDSLVLDAKGMTINEISILSNGKQVPLKYSYDQMNLHVQLDRTYKAKENYTVYVNYISKPNEYKAVHPSLMPGEKGLYFINPTGAIRGKPTQIWSQGETEANSYWFPTIDKPNQKTTDEITLTVPDKYLTLSNGLMTGQKKNSDGTRTDTWKMDLPHAPYLVFIGVGEYAVIKDHYKNKEVSYYVEKEYAPYARRIFGNTPEMIAFYSRITGVDYPWPKYAQITGRDYIFGAMENTSATLHEEAAQEDARELVDGNEWEDIIAHELFHQWFGDYVTTESWSNITVNESFADYSETLWEEYKYGKDAGQAHIYGDRRQYTGTPANFEKSLVRFNYDNALDAFDQVGYQKGGCILHMLRNYVGDSAFFKSLNLYLNTNKFGNGEAQQLRLAFEQVTGEDLNWFFNQWYYQPGHPKLNISYVYGNGTAVAIVKQLQPNLYRLPMAIDVYEGNTKKRYKVWSQNAADTFSFPVAGRPDLINVDADKVLLAEKTDNKTAANFVFQYHHAGSYIDRREAIAYFVNHPNEPDRLQVLAGVLKDDKERDDLRRFILFNLKLTNDTVKQVFGEIYKDLAQHAKNGLVRQAAISGLAGDTAHVGSYKNLFRQSLTDSSYEAAGAALSGLGNTDPQEALQRARNMEAQPSKNGLRNAIAGRLALSGDEQDFEWIYRRFELSGVNDKFSLMDAMATAIGRSKIDERIRGQVDLILAFRDALPPFLGTFGVPDVNSHMQAAAETQRKAGNEAIFNYINTKFPAEYRLMSK